MNIQINLPKSTIYLILLGISFFFNGYVSMYFNHIFRRKFILKHLYYAYILSFIWKSITYFIYRFQELRNKTSKKLSENAYKKTLFSANKKLITLTALIDFTIKFFLIQILNNRPNYDSPMLRYDVKFFFLFIVYKLSPQFNGYNFYYSHKISLFIILILSVIQLISIFPFSRDTLSNYLFKKIPLLFVCEFLMSIKEMCENIMLRKNKVNPFLILSMQGILELFFSLITFIMLYITGGLVDGRNRRFSRLMSDIVRFVVIFSIMVSYDIFKIIVNSKFTCYHWIVSENFVRVILGIMFSYRHFGRFEMIMLVRNIVIFLSFIVFCDLIILNFNEENRRLNFGETHKPNTLIEENENEGTELET